MGGGSKIMPGHGWFHDLVMPFMKKFLVQFNGMVAI